MLFEICKSFVFIGMSLPEIRMVRIGDSYFILFYQ